ncbi:unnamed protein product, partial [Coregonus sp. 'balchen']
MLYIYFAIAVFSPLREVQDITIAQNKTNKIDRGVFFGPENLQRLNLSHNLIGEIYSYTFENLPNILELDSSYNHIGALGYQAFTGLPHLQKTLGTDGYLAPLPNIQLLRLADNKITSLEGLAAAFHSLSWIILYRKRFHCDCGLEDFLTWLNGTKVTFPDPGVDEFSCDFPSNLHGVSLLNYSTVISCEEDDEGLVQELRLSLFVVCSALIVLIIVGMIVLDSVDPSSKFTKRILEGPRKNPPADGPRYNAYLCFSNNDYKWVETALLKRLDSQLAERNILRCCFEARDFIPGEDHLSNIRDATFGSRQTVCIVSKEFLKDGWCLEAFTLAQSRMLEEHRDFLIMVIVGKVPHYRLMKCEAIRTFVQKREYLQWPEDTQDIEWFYEKLMSKILKHRKIKKNIAKDNKGDITL